MARELQIVISQQGAEQTQREIAKVEASLRGVETAAGGADQKMSAIQQHAPELAERFKKLDENIKGAREKIDQFKESTERTDGAMGGATRQTDAWRDAILRYVSAGAVIQAMRKTGEWADRINDVHEATGLSKTSLQQWDIIARQNGTTLDNVARAAQRLGADLVQGDKSVVAGVQKLGFEVEDLLGMDPDARFRAVASAIGGIEDPALRAAAAEEVMKRAGIDLITVMQEIARGADRDAPALADAWIDAGVIVQRSFDAMIEKSKQVGMAFLLLPTVVSNWTQGWADATNMALFGGRNVLTGNVSDRLRREFALPTPQSDVGNDGLDNEAIVRRIFGGAAPGLAMPDFAAVERELTDSTKALITARRNAAPPTELNAEIEGLLARSATNAWSVQARGMNFVGAPGWRPFENPQLLTQDLQTTGWQPPWAPYAGTVGMNASGASGGAGLGGFMSGRGGQALGMGLGMLTQFLPGLSRTGSSVGSTAGSMIGMLAGGPLAPILGPIGGLVGGLFGKLFGPSEKDKTKDARNSFIEQFGGMGELTRIAGESGFSLDKFFSATKVKDFEAEVRKLNAAWDAHNEKVRAAEQVILDANLAFQPLLEQAIDLGVRLPESLRLGIESLIEMGGLTGDTAALFAQLTGQTEVDFRLMQETAQRYGVDLAALGPAFQSARLHDAARTIIDDFDILVENGTDVGTVLFGMQDEISALVQESIRFGVDIPANMQPWIEELMRANLLTDENGELITDLSGLSFSAPIVSQYQQIIDKLQELIDRLTGPLQAAIADIPRNVDINVNANYSGPDLPEINGGPERLSRGGLVLGRGRVLYFDAGGFVPRGSDTVPAMLTPGEMVLRKESVARLVRGDWPQGGGITVNLGENSVNIAGARNEREFEEQLGKAMVQGMKRRGVRLNAA